MAKRAAAAAKPGQRQLFPEALQDQRQMTMQVLVPAETARTIAAEQARRDRQAKQTNPRRRRRNGTGPYGATYSVHTAQGLSSPHSERYSAMAAADSLARHGHTATVYRHEADGSTILLDTVPPSLKKKGRAKVRNPGWSVLEETGRLGGRRWVFAKKADAMKQARAIAKASTPGNGAYVVDAYGRRTVFVSAKVPKPRKQQGNPRSAWGKKMRRVFDAVAAVPAEQRYEVARAFSRATLIAALAQNDRNGVYTDADAKAEGFPPLTRDEAAELVVGQVSDGVSNGRRRRRTAKRAACNCGPASNPPKLRTIARREAAQLSRIERAKCTECGHGKKEHGQAGCSVRGCNCERHGQKRARRRANPPTRVHCIIQLTQREMAMWHTNAGRLKIMATGRRIAKQHGGYARIVAADGVTRLATVGG